MPLPLPPDSWDSGLLLTFRLTPNGYGLVAINDDGSPISSGGSGSAGGSSFAIFGSASSVPIASSSTMASYTVPSSPQTAFCGFNAWGDRYADFKITVNGQEVFRKILNASDPTPTLDISAKPYKLSAGDVVHLDVTNIGFGAGTYNGTMLFTNTF